MHVSGSTACCCTYYGSGVAHLLHCIVGNIIRQCSGGRCVTLKSTRRRKQQLLSRLLLLLLLPLLLLQC